MLKGKFITFEGGECTGKTSIIIELEKALKEKGYKVIVTREPGGIDIAEQIRNIILNPENTKMTSETEALLYAASRTQHLKEKVIPALEEGYVVLCDRYLDSSLVYQGIARGLGRESVLNINYFATKYMPDLTLFIDVEPEIALKRLENRQGKVDRLDSETLDFHKLVYNGYKELANEYKERIVSIDGTKPLEEVIKDSIELVEKFLEK